MLGRCGPIRLIEGLRGPREGVASSRKAGFWKYKNFYMEGLEANHGKTRQRDVHYLKSLPLGKDLPIHVWIILVLLSMHCKSMLIKALKYMTAYIPITINKRAAIKALSIGLFDNVLISHPPAGGGCSVPRAWPSPRSCTRASVSSASSTSGNSTCQARCSERERNGAGFGPSGH